MSGTDRLMATFYSPEWIDLPGEFHNWLMSFLLEHKAMNAPFVIVGGFNVWHRKPKCTVRNCTPNGGMACDRWLDHTLLHNQNTCCNFSSSNPITFTRNTITKFGNRTLYISSCFFRRHKYFYPYSCTNCSTSCWFERKAVKAPFGFLNGFSAPNCTLRWSHIAVPTACNKGYSSESNCTRPVWLFSLDKVF